VKKYLVTAMTVAVLTGCAATPQQPLMTFGDPAVEALNDSAQRVARAAEQAALAESAKNSPDRVTQVYGIDLQGLPPELRDPLLLEGGFHGELETFLLSLAGAIGWERPIIFGEKSAAPLLVTMSEQRRPAIYWFADAGYQIGNKADVVVNPDLKQVILTYKMP